MSSHEGTPKVTTRQNGIGKNPTAWYLPCLGSDIHHLSTGASHTPHRRKAGRCKRAHSELLAQYFLSLPCASRTFYDAHMKLQIKVLYQFFHSIITGLYYFVFHSGCADFNVCCHLYTLFPPQLPLFKIETAALRFLKGWLANRFFHSLPFCT